MEQDAAKIAAAKRRKAKKAKKKRIIGWIVLAVAAVALGVGGWMLYRYLQTQKTGETLTSYVATAVREGEVTSAISGSGTLTANRSASYTAPGADTMVKEVRFITGDTVTEGDVVMTLSCDEVDEELDSLEEQLESVLESLATVDQQVSTLNVVAPKRGVVKEIRADVGTVADDADYLCLLSTDGKMKVVIEQTDGMKKYDVVTVDIAGTSVEGVIAELDDEANTASVTVEDDGYALGEKAIVTDASGSTIGSGTLDVNEYIKVTAASGRIASVNCVVNKTYAKGRALFKLESGAQSTQYLSYKEQRDSLQKQIQDLKDELTIKAGWDGLLTSLSVSEGDKVAAGGELCSLSSTDGYQLTLSVDELDISSVQHDQAAVVTLDAISGEFAGTVKNISYAGSGNYVTSFSVTVETEPIEGAYPGMSASAEIVIETSGESLIVPVGALQYEGRGEEQKAYLLIAGDDVKDGDSLSGSQVDVDSLEKRYVTTGMSDGSYIVVSGDGVASGTLILQRRITTTAKPSDDSSSTSASTFTMGGTQSGSGGNMPNFGGGMPSGGMPGGGMPGGFGG